MLSKDSFYIDGFGNPYKIQKMTSKTVLFTPVKSEYVEQDETSSDYFLYDTNRKALDEPDTSRKPIRFKLSNNFSTRGLATFCETKNGSIAEMVEIEGDLFTVEHNHG